MFEIVRKKWLVYLFLGLSFCFCGCESKKIADSGEKIVVVTTLFPLFDFARTIGGGKASVFLLLPPGVEAHSFEPRPEDILRINKAKIFIYTNKAMEPWVEKILKSIDNSDITVVESGLGVIYDNDISLHHQHLEQHGNKEKDSFDPHIWLDFDRAKKMVDNITAAFIKVDKKNEDFYKKNADDFKNRLTLLDESYKSNLKHCKTRHFFYAGHFAFGYMAKRYNLKYVTALSTLSPEEEPKPENIAKMIKEIKNSKVDYIFYEDFFSPKLAEAISKETGALLLKINPAHNISKDEMERGITFINLMEQNLAQLKKGLECQ